ncbi:MAG: NADH-quinone oxidoreductase subunit J [Odoribacteraceae bacterium]|jgi:NADH-quinone oxidoreductase subunit J|nr:NADH-quinone oxidoreductase subunit J [Odoribacteraceae bacterium]
MNIPIQETVFFLLAAVIVIFSILTVTTRRILRSATYLLFVLFATAGIYFQLEYSFLGAVQLTIYAGGIIILYVFSILLTNQQADEKLEKIKNSKVVAGALAAVAGLGITLFLLLTHSFGPSRLAGGEVPVKEIGTALMGTSKYQYLLPFEVISILLLACIVGGIMIARKR